MKTIKVVKAFFLNWIDGTVTHFEVGVHEVEAAVASHWFVTAHSVEHEVVVVKTDAENEAEALAIKAKADAEALALKAKSDVDAEALAIKAKAEADAQALEAAAAAKLTGDAKKK